VSDYETLVEPLLEVLDLDDDGLRVAAIGGGTGLSRALRAIRHYTDEVTAVVAVADDGGSSGRLAPALGIPPPGDLRNALLALGGDESVWRDLIEYRFTGGDVAGHSLGNLIIAALADVEGDFEEALEVVRRMLGARGRVVPATTVPIRLEATVDGRAVSGQVAVALARGRLEALRIVPTDPPPSPRAIDALERADQIVLGPGSLYTSIAACLLVPGIAAAVSASAADLVYVCNLVTQDGETLGMDAADHVEALIEVAGIRPPDVVVAHHGPVRTVGETAPVPADRDRIAGLGCRLETADLADRNAPAPLHDPVRLGAVLRRLA
jgi:uncharacterized cofD-like protein